MFIGHFAAGLALSGRARGVPVAVFVGGAFVLDMLWVVFAVSRLDPTPSSDWSHSAAMAAVWSTAFAAAFARYGRHAVPALWAAVFSHFLLDLVVQGATLYPHAPPELLIPVLATTHARALQLLLSAACLLVFVRDEWRAGTPSWRSGAACVLVLALAAR